MWEYYVTGPSPFPIDMLRFDMSFPVMPDDSSAIQNSIEGEVDLVERVRLRSSVKPPNAGRWESFGMTISDVREVSS